jgi:2-oxoglutarate ferredoxin oxidoreductase subunit alpha
VTVQSVSLTIAGSGGAGVVTAGSLLLDAAARAGWYALMSRSSGPQIRGGEAAAMLRFATEPIMSHDDSFHLLMAIDWDNITRFSAEIPLTAASLIVGDPAHGDAPAGLLKNNPRQAALPMSEIAGTIENGRPNMVALGAIAAMIGLPPAAMRIVVERALKKKGAAAIEASMAAFFAGIDAAANLPAIPKLPAVAVDTTPRWSITGNEATGLGAIRGGVRFVAAYPITPATEVLEWLAPSLAKVGGMLVQAEDELASINQIIGASYGGTPSMTATSGPGLSLMIESLGLAVAAEVPLVVVDVMRVGPSTGIATKSEQSDLNIAVYGLHGDAPHVVVAANSVADCLFTTQWAVHLAEAMQVPTLVLTDQAMGQARAILPKPAELAFIGQREVARQAVEGQRYKRYAMTGSGVSPMAIPGTPGLTHTADGLEHNEFGTPLLAGLGPPGADGQAPAQDHRLQLWRPLGRNHRLGSRRWRHGDHHLGFGHRPGARSPATSRGRRRQGAPDFAAPDRAGAAGKNGRGAEGHQTRRGRRAVAQRPVLPHAARLLRSAGKDSVAAPGRPAALRPEPDPRSTEATYRRERLMESCAQKKKFLAKDYKSDLKPIWCPGCGDYTVLNAITRALAEMALPPEEVAVVSGIGCSSRIPAYTSVYGFHGVHGRALPVATGLKLARPDLTVLVTGGDGDGFSIGGNHFLHACRRNVDLTYIVMDNQVYGMTKGQASPTTAPDWEGSKLTPEGTGINPFQPLVVGLASGANFIARVSSSDPVNMAQIMVEAIRHPGFSLVQVLSPCVTFRPEQQEWRDIVRTAVVDYTDDAARAARRLMTDDGFNVGKVLYKGSRPPYRPEFENTDGSIGELEARFAL